MTDRRLRPAAFGRPAIVLALVLAVAGCRRGAAPEPASALEAREQSEPDDDRFVRDLENDVVLAPYLRRAESLRLQVLVAHPERDANGATVLARHGFRADRDYFYPASAVKLCAAVGALEKLGELDEASRLAIGPRTPLRLTYEDETVETTVADELTRALVVSDNEAYNRLLDFVGPSELSARMHALGLESAILSRRLASSDRTPPMVELLPGGGPPLLVAERADSATEVDEGPVLVGTAHLDGARRRIAGPMDFGGKNRVSLHDLQDLLIMVARPELAPRTGPSLGADERALLLATLGALPSESVRGAGRATDRLHKPLRDAVAARVPGHAVRVVGKGGRALGFFVENSLVVDETADTFFFVAVAVYANRNDVVNDDRYDYETIAVPFVRRLGVFLADRWLVSSEG